jgi:hypothetical protein
MGGNDSVKRPRRRARNVGLAVLVVCVAWVGFQVYAALTATPGMAVDYPAKVAELIRAHQPAGTRPGDPNAWELAERAAAECQPVHEEFRNRPGPGFLDVSLLYTPMRYDTPGYDRETQARLKADAMEALEMLRQRGVYDILAEAAKTPRAQRETPASAPLVQMMLPSLGQMRQMARVCAARMKLAADAGDGAEFARAYEEMLGLGRICTQQSFIIEHLVGYAITALANGELARCCIERRWDEGTLRACAEALERQGARMARLDLALEAERYSVLDTIQWTHTDDGRGSGRLILTALPMFTGGGAPGGTWLGKLAQYRIVNLAGVAYPSKKAVTARTNDYFNKVLNWYRASADARLQLKFHPDTAAEDLPERYVILRLLLPAMGKAIQSSTQHELGITGTRVLLAIELFRSRRDEYPETLHELVPEFLPGTPVDTNGVPLAYRRFSGGEDPHGRAYILYALGEDRRDDGGKTNKNTWLALGPRGQGLDYVVNQPREPQPPEETPAAGPAEATPPAEPAPPGP